MENVLPQKLFVYMEDDGDGLFFPIANDAVEGIDAGTIVGIYEFKEIRTVTVTTTLQ